MDEGARRELEECIDRLAATPAGEALPADAEIVVDALLTALECGELRAAERDADGEWHAVPWVKRGILLAFRAGQLTDMSPPGSPMRYFDRHTVPVQALDVPPPRDGGTPAARATNAHSAAFAFPSTGGAVTRITIASPRSPTTSSRFARGCNRIAIVVSISQCPGWDSNPHAPEDNRV